MMTVRVRPANLRMTQRVLALVEPDAVAMAIETPIGAPNSSMVLPNPLKIIWFVLARGYMVIAVFNAAVCIIKLPAAMPLAVSLFALVV